MKTAVQDAVCSFACKIIAARIGETVEVTTRPEREKRNSEEVEELWDSRTRRYAVEHTIVESFERQIANIERIKRLLTPVKDMLAGKLPGRFVLAVRERETSAARVPFSLAHEEVVRLVLDAVGRLQVGETITLRSAKLPFEMRLHFRHRQDSSVVLYSDIEGDPDMRRLERVRRAFDEKCPKLARACHDGRTSVLVIESNDSQHASYTVIYQAVKRALAGRSDQPNIIMLIQTDGSPMQCWVLKEGEYLGDDVPRPNGIRCYTEGQV